MLDMPFKTDAERHQHEHAVEALCEEFPDQCPLVRASYRERLQQSLADASIRTYLPIFISRQIRQRLRTSEHLPNH